MAPFPSDQVAPLFPACVEPVCSMRMRCLEFFTHMQDMSQDQPTELFYEASVKQINLRRVRQSPTQLSAASRYLPAEPTNKMHKGTPNSILNRAGRRMPAGIEILVDILAREALKKVLAEQLRMESADDEPQLIACSDTYNERAMASDWRCGDQVLSGREFCDAGSFSQNLIKLRKKSDMSVAERGGSDFHIQFQLSLPIVPASLWRTLAGSKGV
jgi:hypothetical protein